jgi:ubiquinone/menaquinone biosynthesis C-methylase UbiE
LVPDVYATITQAEPAVLEGLAQILELQAADRQQLEMREAYLAGIEFPSGARVVEVGCGTGAVTRALAARPGVAEAVGVDPSPVFLAKARQVAVAAPNVTFIQGDARQLPLNDCSFDVAVFHKALCHVPGPERALAEAHRILRSGGWLAVFEGDYATATCACGDRDPLQACIEAAVDLLAHDRFLVRRLPQLVHAAGFELERLRGHTHVEAPSSNGYMLGIVDRGADALCVSGRISLETAESLKAEAHRRSDHGQFFASIAYASLTAREPS